MSDISVWEELKKTIKPLCTKKQNENKKVPPPPRLRVRRAPVAELSYILDLHHLTLEQAYGVLKKFLTLHQRNGSKKITIITGKGLLSPGTIKNEIELWLDTPVFMDKIRTYAWKNGGGALDIELKKEKKS